MYSVFIEEQEFYGYHGASDQERAVGHRFTVSLEVAIDSMLPVSDEVGDTVDYSQLATIVQKVNEMSSFKTVEALARALCQEIFHFIPTASAINLTLSKLHPPFVQVARSAGVHVNMDRGDYAKT